MQYRKINIQDDLNIIVDPYEVNTIMNSLSEGIRINVKSPNISDIKLKVVYGAIIPQVHSSIEEFDEEVSNSVGRALGYILNGNCILLELKDILLADNPLDNGNLPFAALINTDLLIGTSKHSISAFLRYSNLCVEDNIINRSCIFAINKQEDRIKSILTEYNWRSIIDKDRMLRIAKGIK